jgi:hypothetical protein
MAVVWPGVSYGALLYGAFRAWWLPCPCGSDQARVARYQVRFARTHALLPARNGIRPDTLHVCFHVVLIAVVVLLDVWAFPRDDTVMHR